MGFVRNPLIQYGVLGFQGCLMGRLHGGMPPAFGVGDGVNHRVTKMSSSDIDQIVRPMCFLRRLDVMASRVAGFRGFGLISV